MNEHSSLRALTGHRRYMFTADDYLLLDCSGAFREHAKTELIGGTIYAVNAQHVPHAKAHTSLFQALALACAHSRQDFAILIEVSVALSPNDMPQPDILLAHDLPEQGPVPVGSVALVVEIAHSSLDHDLGEKQHSYAAAGIFEYWVADVEGRVIHQLWSPSDGAYVERRTIPFGEAIVSATIEGLTVPTGSL